MNLKKRFGRVASGILSVALIVSMFASSVAAATYQLAAAGDNVVDRYYVNGIEQQIKTRSGYPAQATRDTNKLLFDVPIDATSFSLTFNDGLTVTNVGTYVNGNGFIRRLEIKASDVPAELIASNGCFKKGVYSYSASNAKGSSGDTLQFYGVLYVDNTSESNSSSIVMSYYMGCEPDKGFPGTYRPCKATNVSKLKLGLENYIGEYYYVVYWQAESIDSRDVKVPSGAVQEPKSVYPVYVSPMYFATEYDPVNCEYGAAQCNTTFGGFLPRGTYVIRIYNAKGVRVNANSGYTDENMAVLGNSKQTSDFNIPAVKPAKPVNPIIVVPGEDPNGPVAPVYTGAPIDATLDGNKIPLTDVVKKPDGSVDLTDAAKKDLPKGPHKLVVTLDDGTKKEATVYGEKEPAPSSATLDGNNIPLTNVVKNPDGTYDLTDDAKKNVADGAHKLVVNLDDGTKKEFTVYGAGGVEGFVARLYRVVLERQPDPAGHKAWVDALKNRVQLADGSGTANGLSTALGFFNSDEFLGKNVTDDDFIRRCYKTFFDREPDAAGYAEWMKLLKSGTSRTDIIKGFANSNEWVMLCWGFDINSGAAGVPDTTGIPYNEDAVNFVRRIYTVALGRPGDPIGVTAWSIALIQKTASGSQVAKGLFFSPELEAQKISDKDFITRLYGVFLDRQPDAKGLADWTAYLQATDRVKTFDAFTSNGEWKALCAKYGINP